MIFHAALIISLDVLRLLRNFAANAGLRFRTPEEYFLQEEERPFVRDFDPTVFLAEGAVKSTSASTSWDGPPHGNLCTTRDTNIWKCSSDHIFEDEWSRHCSILR